MHTLLASALLVAALGLVSCASTTSSSQPTGLAPWRVIGKSREGRPVRRMDIGTGGPRVALIAGIHGNEREGGRHLEELLAVIAQQPANVRVYEDANPDGTAANRRTTSTGVDPNRNWPAFNFKADPRRGPSPLSEPAIAALHADLVTFDPQLVIVLHSISSGGPFVNYDGPAEGFAERFAQAAGEPWRVKASMGYATPGSLGTWMGIDREVPILTIEFKRGSPPEVTGPPLLRGLEAVLRDGPLESSTQVN